jgi:hypothetical protein
MTVKRTKGVWRRRGSAFVYDDVEVHFDNPAHPTPEEQEPLKNFFKSLLPRGQVARLKPHAQELGIGLEDLDEASKLIDKNGHVRPKDRLAFKLHVERAEKKIELAQVEKTYVPLARDAVKTKTQRKEGGENSHGMSGEERLRRNQWIQKEVDRLCLKKRMSYKGACEWVAKNLLEEFKTEHPRTGELKSLHRDHIRKRIAKNPFNHK